MQLTAADEMRAATAEATVGRSMSGRQPMADIVQQVPMCAPPNRVFDVVTQPDIIGEWITWSTNGRVGIRAGRRPIDLWRTIVTTSRLAEVFELRCTQADPDRTNTVIGFAETPSNGGTQVRFYHRGWASAKRAPPKLLSLWAV